MMTTPEKTPTNANFRKLRENRLATRVGLAALLILLAVSVSVAHAEDAGKAGGKPKIVFLGIWHRSMPLVERASRDTKTPVVMQKINSFLEENPTVNIPYRLIYVLNLDQSLTTTLVQKLRQAKAKGQKFKVVSLDHRDSQISLDKAGFLVHDKTVRKYWRYNGLVNMKRLLDYSAATFLGEKREILDPIVVPDFGIYHPASTEVFPTAAAYKKWHTKQLFHTPGAPWVVMIIHASFWVTGDTNDLNALIRKFEEKGINIATIFGDTQKRILELAAPFKPDLLLAHVHVSLIEGGDGGRADSLRSLNAPFMKPISLLGATVEEWKKDPRGLTPKDVGLHLTILESQGIIEPIVIGGLEAMTSGFRTHKPIPERIDRFVGRALSWIRLRHKKNSEKKVAIIFYCKNMGKSDLLRGSPTGAYLDGPRSLVATLRAMKKAGYKINRLPQDEKELLQWVMESARNIGPWAKGELAELVDKGHPALVSRTTYLKWFQTIPLPLQKLVTKTFGPAPGKLMTITVNQKPQIVIPYINLGNVILLPQPIRGEAQNETLLHNRKLPPPHNYIAFYFWLRKKFHADAVIHFGTHGTLELLPLKAAGLSSNDWGDILLGNMPNINPWILDNLGEATLAKRRAYAVLIGHLVPPIVGAGLSGEYKTIHGEIDKFDTLEEGLLREQFRKSIKQRADALHLFADLQYTPSNPLTDMDIRKLSIYLHEIYNNQTPIKLHVLGKTPATEDLIPYIVSILGTRFLDVLAKSFTIPEDENHVPGDRDMYLRPKAEAIIRAILVAGKTYPEALKNNGGKEEISPKLKKKLDFANSLFRRFALTGRELKNLLRALNGEFIAPGPGNDPVRNPAAIPTGRNLYAVNPEEIPVRPAWETAKIMVDQLLAKTMKKNGHYPEKIAFDLNGHETMRHYGVTEGEIMYLIGVRPIWNENNLVLNVKLIPSAELKRPRIDVFLAMGGSYRDNFPSRVELLDKAIRLVAKLKEPKNQVRAYSLKIEKSLLAKKYSAKAARNLSLARIFGAKPGEFGTRILNLIPRSGVWDKTSEVTDVYTDTMSYLYTKGTWGVQEKVLYKAAMQGTDTIMRTWASNMSSPLTNHHFYEYLGGLNLAVKKMTGKNPAAYVADVRNPDRARVEVFEKILQREFRVRLFNEKWIRGMKSNGYAGAGQMAELVKNTFGWKVTRPESVRDDTWHEIVNIYVRDKYNLQMKKWFEKENPHSLQEISATLLEAARKGMWNASKKDLADVAKTYIESVAKYGPSAGLVTGGNTKLNKFAKKTYNAPGSKPNPQVLAKFKQQLEKSAGAKAKDRIQGSKLAKEAPKKPQKNQVLNSRPPLTGLLIALAALLLLYAGYRFRSGATAPSVKDEE